jgi:choline dehydrogenase-like flavoprotein
VNLFVRDGSILPATGIANPGLTMQSLATRMGDYRIAQGESIFTPILEI